MAESEHAAVDSVSYPIPAGRELFRRSIGPIRMRLLRLGAPVTVAGALLLTGCGSEKADSFGSNPPTTAAVAPTSSPPAPAAPPAAPPEPDAATAAKYVAALNAIDPDLVHGKAAQAISRGRETCRTIQEYPADRLKQIEVTGARWTSPAHPEGRQPTMAQPILDTTHEYLCPTY